MPRRVKHTVGRRGYENMTVGIRDMHIRVAVCLTSTCSGVTRDSWPISSTAHDYLRAERGPNDATSLSREGETCADRSDPPHAVYRDGAARERLGHFLRGGGMDTCPLMICTFLPLAFAFAFCTFERVLLACHFLLVARLRRFLFLVPERAWPFSLSSFFSRT